jgi:hypothetical protein
MGLARLAGVAWVGLAVTVPAAAQELTPARAERFVVGKTFAFSCFDGTTGAGRIHADGSVAGTLQMKGTGLLRHARLPAGTLQVKGERVCASLKGMPFEPCFNVQQTGAQSFRGSISGFGFAYCDFTRRGNGRGEFMRTATRERSKPMALRSSYAE